MKPLFPLDFLTEISRFTVFIFCLFLLTSCSSQTHDLSQAFTYPSPDLTKETELHILSYNIYMRSPRLFFWNQQKERTLLLPQFLRGYDVLVLQEVFGANIRGQLIDSLKKDYPYQSKLLGEDGAFHEDGGVLVLSKWPVEEEKQILYGENCAGADCLAQKGAIYSKIKKGDRFYHVISTHLQASSEHAEIRSQQFSLMNKLKDEANIPIIEPLIIAGDLNVDMFKDSIQGEYADMMETLGAVYPGYRGDNPPAPTIDAHANSHKEGNRKSFLDYVLYHKDHLAPDSAYNEVRICKVGELDLSDHYAVYGYFSFEN